MNELMTYALEPLYISNKKLLCLEHQAILNEGAREIVGDALQYIVGAISEYGLVATIAGAPAGPVLETITDAGFAAESVASAMGTIGEVTTAFGELQEIIGAIFSLSLKGGFKSFYEEVKGIWQQIGDLLPDAGEEALEKYVKKAKKTIKDILGKFGDFISDAVKLVIPDATIGTAVGEGLQALVMKIAENAYSTLTGVIEKLGQFQQIITDPQYALNLFNDIFDTVDEFLVDLQNKMTEEPDGVKGIMTKIAKATPTGMVASSVAEKAVTAFQDFIKEKRPVILKLVDKITSVMFPAIFAMMASYQILVNEEWKKDIEDTEDTEDEEDTLAAGYMPPNLTLLEVLGAGLGVPQQIGYGKNYHTVNPEPITWENLEGPEYLITARDDGKFLASVSLPSHDLSTALYEFGDEESAMAWVRNTFDKFYREKMVSET